MKDINVKLVRTQVEALKDFIDDYIVAMNERKKTLDDDDKLHVAVLKEISAKLYGLLGKDQLKYSLSLKATHAFGICILLDATNVQPTTYIGNLLLGITNITRKNYQ